MKILVADQEVQYRTKLVELINKMGHIAVETIDSREVIKECQHKCPDLIFLDYMLSGVTAPDLVKQIRRIGGNAAWNPIIVMASEISEHDKIAVLEAGADDFMLKSIDDINIQFKLNTAKRQFDLKDDVFTVAHDLVMANRALESAVTPDALTGIMDMNNFYRQLEKQWFTAKKNNSYLSIILLDLDNFNEFNQLYTVTQGDVTIKMVANNLKQEIAKIPNAEIARTGGVTFGILLPRMEQDAAVKIAKQLCAFILAMKIPHAKSSNNEYLTASLGVSTTDKTNLNKSLDLLEAADFALYQAKHKGRNRVFFETTDL